MKKLLCLLLALCLTAAPASAAGSLSDGTARALCAMSPQPSLGTPGGEWTVFALSRWGGDLPDGWLEGYLERLAGVVTERGGVLHARKYTEYSRVVIALTALGEDPRGFAGYDLIAPLADVEQTTYQGVNGAMYALLALDSGGYDAPGAREQYVSRILESELPDGGFALAGESPDPDVTAVALQALAPYRGDAAVGAAVERALARLSQMQDANGGFSAWGGESCESTAQVIIALGELGLSHDDPRFVKDGAGLMQNLLSYRLPDGSFCHAAGGESDLMATEQALCALISAERAESIYHRQAGQPLPGWETLARLVWTLLLCL